MPSQICVTLVATLIFVRSIASGIEGDSLTTDPADSSPADATTDQQDNLPQGARDTTSLTAKDTDLRDILRGLALQHGLNILVDNSIEKRVTVSLQSICVFDALELLAEQNDLNLVFERGIFKIIARPPAPAPLWVPRISWNENLLSVDFKNDDIEHVIRLTQEKTGRNILLISGTTGSVSGKLIDVDFDVGFTQLMNNNGFAVQRKGGIYLVSRLDYFVGSDGHSSPERNGPYWVSIRDTLVTVDVTNAPLERVLVDAIRQLGTDVVFYDQISGNVTARATSVPLDRALDLLLRNTEYTYRRSDGVFFVGSKANKALITTRLLRLKYLRADVAIDLIPQSITSQATVKVSKEHNGFVVIGSMDIASQLEEYLAVLDKPVAQVLIEALVIDVDISKGSEHGVQLGLGLGQDTTTFRRQGQLIPGVDMKFRGPAVNTMLKQIGKVELLGKQVDFAKLGVLPDDFYLNVKALEEEGLVNVRSRPLLATINGHKATLSVGTTQYFLLKTTTPYRDQNQVVFQESQTFQTIDADVSLELTPFVGADGSITLEIRPDFRTPVGQLSPEVPPTISRRTLSSTLVVKDGETIVLGGLVQDSESEVASRTPILGYIPLIEKLFSYTSSVKRKSELLIYVTPRISYGEAFQTAYKSEYND